MLFGREGLIGQQDYRRAEVPDIVIARLSGQGVINR